MDVGSTSTPYGTNLVNTVGELAQDYQAWAKKRGKEIGLPASFFVKLTITIPEDPIGLPKGGFITPPVLTWGDLGVKRPSNLEEIKPFIISTAEYNELAEISKRVKEFLASPEAPNYPGFLDATFLEVTGYSQVDGKLIPLNAISAPQSKPMIGINPIPQRKAVSAAKPESLTTSQFLEANSVDELSALFLKLGVSGDELLTAFNAKDFTELPGSVEDIVQIYNDTK